MEAHQTIINALLRASMTETALVKNTGMAYGPLRHVLAVLISEGRIVKEGMRYRLVEKKPAKSTP